MEIRTANNVYDIETKVVVRTNKNRTVETDKFLDIQKRLPPYKSDNYHFARCRFKEKGLICTIFYNNEIVKTEILVFELKKMCEKLENLDKIKEFY